ncbi:MAG: peptidylprolyl isomerase [Magnetococcales bacterium]|nr:peptidylprolyl isomerase [Magnetococcales bacterium]
MIKQNHLRLLCLALALICFLPLIQIEVGYTEPLDRIVAIVEAQNVTQKNVKSQIITQSEIDEATAPILARIRAAGEQVDYAKIAEKARDGLILIALQQQMAEQYSITVTEEEIDVVVANVERNNKLEPGSLINVLRNQGINPDQYREELGRKLLQSRLVKLIIKPLVSVSDEEVENLYQQTVSNEAGIEELRLGQILLELDPDTPDYQVKAIAEKALELSKRLKQGESLTSLASQFSNDPTGLNGGDMGWFKRGQLIPAIETAVFRLETGGVTLPIRTPQGFHIFTVIERRITRPQSDQQTVFRVKARHILLPVSTEAENRLAFNGIMAIREKLLAGEATFAELAKTYSKDGTAADGGNLGWFGRGKMVPEFEKAAFDLNVGEISKPVQSQFGWHLILVEERETKAANSLEAKRAELHDLVLETKIQLRYKQWLRDVRARAFVEYR